MDDGFKPFSDYSGQKYLLTLKLSGIEVLERSPLRYLELHWGYYTRGFSKEEVLDGLAPSRHGFIGVGVNLGQLFFGNEHEREPWLRHAGRQFVEHIQLPATSLHSSSEIH